MCANSPFIRGDIKIANPQLNKKATGVNIKILRKDEME